MTHRMGLVLPFVLAIVVSIAMTLWIADRRYEQTGSRAEFAALPPVLSGERSVVLLAEKTIQPIVSANGVVVTGTGDFFLEGPISDADLAYRLVDATPVSVKALIQGGPAGFDCAWAGLAPFAGGGVAMRCGIPSNVRVVEGLGGTMVVALAPPVTAQALPLTAVIGHADKGVVVVVRSDGSRETRPVQLGVSDSNYVEIVSGLSAEEAVLAVPVQSDLDQASR